MTVQQGSNQQKQQRPLKRKAISTPPAKASSAKNPLSTVQGKLPRYSWYVVFKGQIPGIYDCREDCRAQVDKFSNSYYCEFYTRAAALATWKRYFGKPHTESSKVNSSKGVFMKEEVEGSCTVCEST